MKHVAKYSNLCNGLMGLFLSIAVVLPAMADDTEIYVGENEAGDAVRPNILFVVDTSGSMDSFVETRSAYNPSIVYEGDGACFSADRVYYAFDGDPASITCGTSRYFAKDKLACKAAYMPLYGGSATGYYTDNFAKFYPGNSQWYSLSYYQSRHDDWVECRADSGVHGQDDADTRLYPRNNSGMWTTTFSKRINWGGYSSATVYSGNFMNFIATDPDGLRDLTRLDIVKEVVEDIVNSASGINIGLMRFNSDGEGGRVIRKVKPINEVKSSFITALNGLTADGNTPLSESLYEADLYFRGDKPYWGKKSGYDTSVVDAGTGKYISPIEYQCQQNAIILLTDGEPTSDTSANSLVPKLPGFGLASCADDHGDTNGKCLDDLAGYMANVDQSAAFADDQTVKTYTIGFTTKQALLEATGARGKGDYRTAENAVDLATAFNKIINQILAYNSTFSSPAVSVNSFSQTTHRNELYFTLFKPATTPYWDGNLKKYYLGKDADGNRQILDYNSRPAVDELSGFFSTTSRSYWSSVDDGNEVPLGGAAGELPLDREVYTYTAAADPVNAALDVVDNRVSESNAAITSAMLGVPADAPVGTRNTILEWARGVDTKSEFSTPQRLQFGDPLHSQASVVQYGGTEENPDLTIFFSTNDGFFHAIDDLGDDAKLRFSFIPKELLGNLYDLYDNSATTKRPYGLDSSITTWVKDVNQDGIINLATDHVYLYFGMRRGGSSIYALDVTNRDAPVYKWRISNAAGGQFTELGQTWSEPVLAKVKINGVAKTVLFFGGGYDADQDAANKLQADDRGRAVYMVDAETGKRLWWAGPTGSGADLILSGLTNSIPSKLYVADINGNGYSDRMYFGDTGGQLWRMDFNEENTGLSNFAAGGRLAYLGGDAADGTDARRFYHAPSVGLVSYPGHGPYLAVMIGSGWREHPKDTVIRDRIYMLKDRNVFNLPAGTAYGANNEASYLLVDSEADDLVDTTENDIGEGSVAEKNAARTAMASRNGWYINLQEPGGSEYVGEKVLADVVIVAGLAIVPTFRPSAEGEEDDSEVCGANAGKGRAYMINVVDGTPARNFDELGPDDALTRSDRVIDLSRRGIAPTPTVHVGKDGVTVIEGTEVLPTDLSSVHRSYWYERAE